VEATLRKVQQKGNRPAFRVRMKGCGKSAQAGRQLSGHANPIRSKTKKERIQWPADARGKSL